MEGRMNNKCDQIYNNLEDILGTGIFYINPFLFLAFTVFTSSVYCFLVIS